MEKTWMFAEEEGAGAKKQSLVLETVDETMLSSVNDESMNRSVNVAPLNTSRSVVPGAGAGKLMVQLSPPETPAGATVNNNNNITADGTGDNNKYLRDLYSKVVSVRNKGANQSEA